MAKRKKSRTESLMMKDGEEEGKEEKENMNEDED